MTDHTERQQFLDDPDRFAALAADRLAGTKCDVVHHDQYASVLELTFAPTKELAAAGYPMEKARITQFSDQRHALPYALPVGRERLWNHRFPATLQFGMYGQLCLWDPWDSSHLMWTWRCGLLDFVAITQRHLWFEEFYRRTGQWPVEDAPHGRPTANRQRLIARRPDEATAA